ncbi:hypothetical protein [Candidatus Sororendozoicomonas aggregata]|uniref:hypothetical protein n=1 Tax=Candidatus Sororendozoicomonas aggregata TaxID=3073239 RepID=UPI002ED267DC
MTKSSSDTSNVVDLFSGKTLATHDMDKIIRIAPEQDGLEILYSNDSKPGKLYSMKILCWALMKNGDVDALIPWLNKVVPAKELNDPLNGHWEGYYDNVHDQAFFEPPPHKVIELNNAEAFFKIPSENKNLVVQEISDTIGTHAVFTEDQFQSITIVHITSWRLYNDGRIHGMVADENKIETTPVLAGDACLYPAQENNNFRYFFHHVIANKIKHGDPDAIAAFSNMIEK